MLDNICIHISRLLSGWVSQVKINNFVDRALGFHPHMQRKYFKNFSDMVGQYLLSGTINIDTIEEFHKVLPIEKVYPIELREFLLEKNITSLPNNSLFLEFLQTSMNKEIHLIRKKLSGLSNLHAYFLPLNKEKEETAKKLADAINSSPVTIPNDLLEEFRVEVRRFVAANINKISKISKTKPIDIWSEEDDSKSFDPIFSKSVPRDTLDLFDIKRLLGKSIELTHLFNDDPMRFLAYTSNLDIEKYSKYGLPIKLDPPQVSQPVGTISLLPSPKSKFRPIAIPSLILGSLNYPLSRKLQDMGRLIASHGPSSHDKCSNKIRSFINGKRNIYSIDYSSFTDYFPYKLQRVLLEELLKADIISEFDLKVMDIICEGEWELPSLNNKRIRYTNGTPQGTFASFPLASLTHMLLGSMLYRRINPNLKYNKVMPIFVIGDDSVIADDNIYQWMMDIMALLGVPINYDKVLISKTWAEFCSKYITKDFVYLRKKPLVENRNDFNFDREIESFLYYGILPSYFKEELIQFSFVWEGRGILDYQYNNQDDNFRIFEKISNFQKAMLNFEFQPTVEDYKILFNRRDLLAKLFIVAKDPIYPLIKDQTWFEKNISLFYEKSPILDLITPLEKIMLTNMQSEFRRRKKLWYAALQEDLMKNLTLVSRDFDNFTYENRVIIAVINNVQKHYLLNHPKSKLDRALIGSLHKCVNATSDDELTSIFMVGGERSPSHLNDKKGRSD